MYVYCKVEDELSVCLKTKTPNCIPQKKLKLCICVWTPMIWPRTLESTFPFKILSRNSWETTQLSKMLCDDAHLTVQQFEHNISLICWKLVPFLESIWFFSYDFKDRAFHYVSQFKSCVKRTSNSFYCFNGITFN